MRKGHQCRNSTHFFPENRSTQDSLGLLDRSQRASDIPSRVEEGDRTTLDRIFQEARVASTENHVRVASNENHDRVASNNNNDTVVSSDNDIAKTYNDNSKDQEEKENIDGYMMILCLSSSAKMFNLIFITEM